MKFELLQRGFYERAPATVAKQLLGKFLVRTIEKRYVVGKIVETEAYLSAKDEAAHGYKGPTKRNASMYKAGGHAYVHRMRHWNLLDIVAQKEGVPSGVLIRALEPVSGIHTSTKGPGLLCAAMGITHAMDGTDMTNSKSPLFVAQGEHIHPRKIRATTRIGISKSADLPLRFYIIDNSYISRP